jgi:hypothetical protein
VVSTETEPVESPTTKAIRPVEGLLRRAVAGDPAVLPELRAILRQPEVVDILGNLAHRVEVALVDRVAGRDLAFREALTMKLAAMRTELAGPDASPLERQLIERVVLAWLSLREAEYRLTDARPPSTREADYWQRRIDACQRRYLAAVKMLATVRRLAVPVLINQLNIAQQQVNVVTPRTESH